MSANPPSGEQKPVNGWNEWSIHVLKELERHNSELRSMREVIQQLSREVAALNVKAGMWGFLGGLLPALAALLLIILKARA